MNTDRITSWIGFVTSLVVVLQHRGLIDNDLSTFLYAGISLVFGYLTNKRDRKKIEPNKVERENSIKLSGIDFEV